MIEFFYSIELHSYKKIQFEKIIGIKMEHIDLFRSFCFYSLIKELK